MMQYRHQIIRLKMKGRYKKERAVVECIKHLDWIDEGLLIEGIQNYIRNFWNEKLLYEAAAHFKLPEDELEYWLEEARNEYDD